MNSERTKDVIRWAIYKGECKKNLLGSKRRTGEARIGAWFGRCWVYCQMEKHIAKIMTVSFLIAPVLNCVAPPHINVEEPARPLPCGYMERTKLNDLEYLGVKNIDEEVNLIICISVLDKRKIEIDLIKLTSYISNAFSVYSKKDTVVLKMEMSNTNLRYIGRREHKHWKMNLDCIPLYPAITFKLVAVNLHVVGPFEMHLYQKNPPFLRSSPLFRCD